MYNNNNNDNNDNINNNEKLLFVKVFPIYGRLKMYIKTNSTKKVKTLMAFNYDAHIRKHKLWQAVLLFFVDLFNIRHFESSFKG